MENGRIVIVAYQPFAGRENDLEALAKKHVEILRQEGLVTSREPVLMRASDNVVIEVFEWASKEAIASAHSNAAVQKLWQAFGEVCIYVPLGQLKDSANMFADFTPLN